MLFSLTPTSPEWSFYDKTIKDTTYITHGYYTYPAKFIPQLAARLIVDYSEEGELVVDPFVGSGTTIVEAIVKGRRAVGTDINEVATLISKVKSTPIESSVLTQVGFEFVFDVESKTNLRFDSELSEASRNIQLSERVDHWFRPNNKNVLLVLLNNILQVERQDIQDFLLVVFFQILKSCSIWLQKSVKPTRDFSKKEADPLARFKQQLKKMVRGHEQFNHLLSEEVKEQIDDYRIVENSDARRLPCQDGEASLVVTSPPYVTSYEYADLHQLPYLWLQKWDQHADFKRNVIGSSSRRKRDKTFLGSGIADGIVASLQKGKASEEVCHYFADMLESFAEMRRVLKPKGRVAVVIGNTKLKGVDILNAEVFKEQLEHLGFGMERLIHRKIPSKMLPSTRDPSTGRFTSIKDKNKTMAYPSEYILVMRKM